MPKTFAETSPTILQLVEDRVLPTLKILRDKQLIGSYKLPENSRFFPSEEVTILPEHMSFHDGPRSDFGIWDIDIGKVMQARVHSTVTKSGPAYNIYVMTADDTWQTATPEQADQVMAVLGYLPTDHDSDAIAT